MSGERWVVAENGDLINLARFDGLAVNRGEDEARPFEVVAGRLGMEKSLVLSMHETAVAARAEVRRISIRLSAIMPNEAHRTKLEASAVLDELDETVIR